MGCMKTYLCTLHTHFWPSDPDSFTKRPPRIRGSAWLREMPPSRASSRLSGGGGGLGSAAALAELGRVLFVSPPGQNSGTKRRRSSAGGAEAGGQSGPRNKTLCVCGCGAIGRRRVPPCSSETAADKSSRFRTVLRLLHVRAEQRAGIATKMLAGIECRIAAEHFDGDDLPALYWDPASAEYRRADVDAPTPAPPPPPTAAGQLLRAALDASPKLEARNWRAAAAEVLSAVERDADERAQEVARALTWRGRMEAAETALRERHGTPLWASMAGAGADRAWSPEFRFEHVENDDETCKTLFSTTGDTVRAIYNLLKHHGYETSKPLAATSLRAALAAYRAAHGEDAIPGVEVSFTQSTLYLERKQSASGGRPTTLDGVNRVALTLCKLVHNESFRKLQTYYNIDASTLRRYFSHTLIALDNLFTRICGRKRERWRWAQRR